MPRWREHHEENKQVIVHGINAKNLEPQKYNRPQDIPGWERFNATMQTKIRKNWRDQNRVNQYIINSTPEDEIFLRSLKGTRDHLAAFGYQCEKPLGEGKDGKTFFGHPYLDVEKTCVVKVLSRYARNYFALAHLLQKVCQDEDKPAALKTFKVDPALEFMWYRSAYPYTPIERTSDWHNALHEVCRLNSWLCKQYGLLFWDFGFNNGKNYMLDNSSAMRWVDYGGAGLVRTTNYDVTLEGKGAKWKAWMQDLENTRINKECLIDAYDTFLKIAFFLHLQYWQDRHDDRPNNISVYMSAAQTKESVADEIFEYIVPLKLKTAWIKEMFELFKGHDFTLWVTWKKMGKYIDSHVKNT